MAEIKAIFFDLFNTLVKSGNPEAHIMKEFGLDIPYYKVESITCGKTTDGSINEFSKDLASKLGIEANKENLQKMERIIVSELEIVKPFADAEAALRVLKAKGFKLGLISNSWGLGVDKIRKTSKILDLFDVTVFSHETGKFKPNPSIFRECCRKVGIKPWQAIMVGDSPRSDIVGAARLGMKGILLNRTGKRVENLGKVPQISGLKEVGKAIEIARETKPIQIGQPKIKKTKPRENKTSFSRPKRRRI